MSLFSFGQIETNSNPTLDSLLHSSPNKLILVVPAKGKDKLKRAATQQAWDSGNKIMVLKTKQFIEDNFVNSMKVNSTISKQDVKVKLIELFMPIVKRTGNVPQRLGYTAKQEGDYYIIDYYMGIRTKMLLSRLKKAYQKDNSLKEAVDWAVFEKACLANSIN